MCVCVYVKTNIYTHSFPTGRLESRKWVNKSGRCMTKNVKVHTISMFKIYTLKRVDPITYNVKGFYLRTFTGLS